MNLEHLVAEEGNAPWSSWEHSCQRGPHESPLGNDSSPPLNLGLDFSLDTVGAIKIALAGATLEIPLARFMASMATFDEESVPPVLVIHGTRLA